MIEEDRPNDLGRVAVLWAVGISAAFLAGKYPGYWHEADRTFNYPWRHMVVVFAKITVECLLLYLLLAWVPLPRYWHRVLVAALMFLALLVWQAWYMVTDQPGWVYANSGFLLTVVGVLLFDLALRGGRAFWRRLRPGAPDAA